MKNIRIVWAVFVILLFVIGSVIVFGDEEASSIYLESAIAGGDYLAQHIDTTGQFVYERNPVTGDTSQSYNILRHAGTTYSLLELYETTEDRRYRIAAERALGYLSDHTVTCPLSVSRDIVSDEDMRCIQEDGEVKLGGNGLAVLAIAKYTEVTGDNTYLPLAEDLAGFIRALQAEDGEFTTHKFEYGTPTDFVSGYYPGEALFALAQLYDVTGDERYIDAAHAGAEWIITVRDGEKSVHELDHDHWLLYALNELHAHDPRMLYVDHAKKITEAIVNSQHRGLTGAQEIWNGGYYNPPRSTPTATRTEGLMAAYEIFMRSGDVAFATQALEASKRGVEFQLKTQMTDAMARELGADSRSVGGFYESLTDYGIRIDYVQHNISALLALHDREIANHRK